MSEFGFIAKTKALQAKEITTASKPMSKSKLKAVDPKAAEPSKPKILIYGKPGVGKTWTALDFPNVYYVDTEGGADLEHYTDKLKASGGMYLGPKEGSQSFTTIIEQVQALATEQHGFKTLVIDSISKVFNMEIAHEAERLEKAGIKNEFSKDKIPAVRMMKRLVTWLQRIDMNVILIAHEKAEWKNGEQVGETFDCWDKLEYELHLCLNIFKAGNAHKARVRKTRLIGFPAAETFTWSYADFAERYGKDIIEKETTAIELATPEQLAQLKSLLEIVKLPEGTTDKWLSAANAESFEEMDTDKIAKCIDLLKSKIPTTNAA